MRQIPILSALLCIIITSSSIPLPPPSQETVLASPGRRHSLSDAVATGAKASSSVLGQDTIDRINILVDLNAKYLEKVATEAASGEMSREQAQKITGWISDEMKKLEAKAQAVERARSERERRRRRRGFFGFVNRLIKGGSRALGKVVGGVMYGTGKVLEYTVEEAAPRIITDRVKALLKARIDQLVEKMRDRIGPLGTDILVKVAKDLARRSRTRPRPGGSHPPPETPREEAPPWEGPPPEPLPSYEPWQGRRVAVINITEKQFPARAGTHIWADFDDMTMVLTIDFDSETLSGTIRAEGKGILPAHREYCTVSGTLSGTLVLRYVEGWGCWVWELSEGTASITLDSTYERPDTHGGWKSKHEHRQVEADTLILQATQDAIFFLLKGPGIEIPMQGADWRLFCGVSPDPGRENNLSCNLPPILDLQGKIEGPDVVNVDSEEVSFDLTITGKEARLAHDVFWWVDYYDPDARKWTYLIGTRQNISAPLVITRDGPTEELNLDYFRWLLDSYGRMDREGKFLYMRVRAGVGDGLGAHYLLPGPGDVPDPSDRTSYHLPAVMHNFRLRLPKKTAH